MATPFTSAQRAGIRSWLGWSARFHQFDSRLEQAMAAVDSEPDDATHDLVVGWLADLAATETAIRSAWQRIKAVQVGSITLPGAGEVAVLRSEGRRVVGKLASTLGVEVRQDVFGAARFRSFAGHGGLSGAPGNEVKQG